MTALGYVFIVVIPIATYFVVFCLGMWAGRNYQRSEREGE